ncbi:exopolysaccharide biosynthesis polyprenyl glycosylphosphotransferase [Phycicoccus badiiscoriae]|uniref:Exopolysaccharide biosynthesis polyprenyl glycosylphosphotransferase n=1 Tax=Pedococcus badiiscoriae TaxID=642776 RepID=A0A852WDU3_9MICO|nr:sugar transferase [Pedococcus badiiscoriae]NYG07373.1 exopolysaccharide biosynthesis polyprenyl glycosylphosphotransferase [Pedococcus badiiscoriae]
MPVHTKRVQWNVAYRRRAMGGDLLAALGAGSTTALVAMPGTTMASRVLVVALLPVLWLGTLSLSHGYERRFAGSGPEEYRAVMRSAVYLVGAAAFLSFMVRIDVPRLTSLVAVTMLFVLGLGTRQRVRADLYRRRSAGSETQATVIIGNAKTVLPMIREIKRAPQQGLRVVAACVSGLDLSGDARSEVEGVPVFGYPDEAMSAVDLFDAEVVAVSSDPDLHGHELRRLAWSLEERDVELVVSPGLLGVAGPRLSIRPTAGMPLLHIERPVMSGARRMVKSFVDKALTVLLLLAALPVLLAIAVFIRLDSAGPVLFRQTRVGARGEEFQMLKFRTMCVDAEARLAELQRDAGNGVLFKMKSDPRVTRLGRVLRRFSLDELPQLANVLRGEMSLIGPRPPLPREVAEYEPDAVHRLRVRPGLTGLWQVSGRSDLTWDETLRLDLWYVDNWSLTLDLQILVKTFRAVLRGSGAY